MVDTTKLDYLREGIYLLGSDPKLGDQVNGKRYWIHEDGQSAIWYDDKYGQWRIGKRNSIGKAKGSISSYSADNILGPHGVTKWRYYDKIDDYGYINIDTAGTIPRLSRVMTLT